MSRNYQSELLTITQDDRTNIFYFNILKDEYNASQINIIQVYFTDLFEYFSTTTCLYGCIFNIDALSSYNLFNYTKDLKKFFQEHSRALNRYIAATAIIIDSTLIRMILAPFIQLVNKGRPLKFTRDETSATDFIVTELNKDRNSLVALITEPSISHLDHLD